MPTMLLKSPLFTEWSTQLVRLALPDTQPGSALELTLDGQPTACQWDGERLMLKLDFAKDQTRELAWTETERAPSARRELALDAVVAIGQPGRELLVGPQAPFHGFADRAMTCAIACESAFEGATLHQLGDGALFTDYELAYQYAGNRSYVLSLRCYKLEPWVEVGESFSLGMGAGLTWTLNPAKRFTHIISRDSFGNERQPSVEPLGEEHPRDILCRLQMPVLTEYFIPNNRGWFAFHDQREPESEMVGVLGLYGAKWKEPVANMPVLYDRDGRVEWQASLVSGCRHWLLTSTPVESTHTPERRFLFHRLHGEFNALRLDEHLDLTGETTFDASCAQKPGMFVGDDYRDMALRRVQTLPALRSFTPGEWLVENGSMHLAIYRALLEPTAVHQQAVYDALIARFEKWVRQFQGWYRGESDYMKNVIGFSRYLRGMMIGYELLRKDDALSDEQVRCLGSYFAFAARRILDEGRWPHSRTWKHPDHPESVRDLYTYGGEHKPDRLIWTNSLPNFQSDPLCALAQLSGLFQDHPDAIFWREFGLAEVERQLDAYAGESGAWEESINYALYTLSYLVITFRVVKQRWGIDYFQDARVRRFVGWLCRFFGPHDKRFGCHTWPAIGNAVLPQVQTEYLLAYAAELPIDDPLRHDCLAIYQLTQEVVQVSEHYPTVLAAMAPLPNRNYHLVPLASECMDEVGVSMRHRHLETDESYLFQKIGFAKDHYEGDETAFNWYAKGTPLCMDYGTYTGDVGVGGAHNLVQIPDEDSLRRGYLGDHLFSPMVDYTRCEAPVTMKLLWGRVRSFDEIDNKDGKVDRNKTPYFYIGDPNPVGPKCWKVRQLLYVKPDYVVLFDRVYGEVPHRYNLHVTGQEIARDGQIITATGRFDLDLLAYVQHPVDFRMEVGELIPKLRSADRDPAEALLHGQHYLRLYNEQDGIYRTVLFARERQRRVAISSLGEHGIRIETDDYVDYIFLHDETLKVAGEGYAFEGRAGWLRQEAGGAVKACLPDGCHLRAVGHDFAGRGPWSYGMDGADVVTLHGGPPRPVVVTRD